MKKLLALALVLMMVLTLAACGGANKAKIEQNNAAVQAKLDEAVAANDAVCNFYKDNGYLEGDTAAEAQPIVDGLKAIMTDNKAANQEILDKGGYTDEAAAAVIETLTTVITASKDTLAKMEAAQAAE